MNDNMQITGRDLSTHPNAALTPYQLDAILDRSRGGLATFRPHWHRLYFCLLVIAGTIAFVAIACMACHSMR